jgi:hypothetical protein
MWTVAPYLAQVIEADELANTAPDPTLKKRYMRQRLIQEGKLDPNSPLPPQAD